MGQEKNFGSKINSNGFDKRPQDGAKSKGRKQGKTIATILRELLDKDGGLIVQNIYELDENKKETGNIIKYGKIKLPTIETICLAQIKKAAKGDSKSFDIIADRTEGKAQQNISMNVNERKEIADVFPEELTKTDKKFNGTKDK